MTKSVSAAALAQEKKWTRFPVSDVRARSTEPTISDYFKIKRGIATGDNGYFILSAEEIENLILAHPASLGHVRLAESYFRFAISQRPRQPDAYHNLGAALAMQGRYDEAEDFLRTYLRLSPPGKPEPPARLGLLHVDQGRYAEAIPLLRRALALDPRFPLVRKDLVQALRKRAAELEARGGRQEAAALVREAADLVVHDPGGPAGRQDR